MALDVTLDLPLDLKRVCQPSAKVYFPKRKEFGTVVRFDDEVHIKLDQGKQSKTETFQRNDFIEMLQSDAVVAKSRVEIPADDNKPMRVKPRVIVKEAPKLVDVEGNEVVQSNGTLLAVSPPKNTPIDLRPEPMLKGYICEKTGKFSTSLQPGLVEIEYRKVTKKVELMLDSVQLQKLKELGII